MTPAARLSAVIEMLEEIGASAQPADLVAGRYLKARRYIGSKDRKAISDRAWGMLRRKARLDWWLAHLKAEPTTRARLLADLMLTERLVPDAVAARWVEGGYGPAGLAPAEWSLLQALAGRDPFHHDMPAWVRGEYPNWLEPRLAALFGDRLAAEMGALRDEAPVDLRVNTLKSDRDAARGALAEAGYPAEPTRLSPIGLRLPARIALTAQGVFRDGLVEVQDEGSQLVALLTDARPGQAVIDYCAGAGGKTLALAAAMANKGRLVACDVNAARSDRAAQRLRRAGVHNVTRHLLVGEGDKWLKRHAASFDRVLVDAPCSGSGTWRRNPDAKWRLRSETLAELTVTQAGILDAAIRLVRPSGRLVYATCSLLAEENEAQIEAALSRHAGMSAVPIAAVWAETIGGACPSTGPFLRLTPAAQGTDGFFVAVLERGA